MELATLEPARGHLRVEQEAAGRSDILTLYGTRAGERAGGSRRLKIAAYPRDRNGRPLSHREMDLAALDPARGHVCVERTGKHTSRFLQLDAVKKRDVRFSIPGRLEWLDEGRECLLA
jgi:hypothetical protein